VHRLIGCFASSVTIAIVALTDASAQVGGRFDPVADVLIAEIAGPVASAEFIALADSLKPIYLDSFWSSRYPLFHKYYVRPLLGDRRYSVSDAFFERGLLLPFRQYRSEFAVPDSGDIARSTTLLETTVELTPEDPIALCALGYLYLESDRLKEAERFFVRALREDRRMAEARNGRGLAVLKQGKRTRLAIKLLEETVATDPQYAAAWFDLAMAHLGEESVDMHFHFDKVIRKFPDHYDAHHKLGAFYEITRYFEESAAAYRAQIDVNPTHWRAVIGLSRSAVELIRAGKPYPDLGPIETAVENDPPRFLPYLGEVQMALEEFEAADATYARYLTMLPQDSLALYKDLSFVAEPAELDTLNNLQGDGLERFAKRFWWRRHPLPTREVNPRYLEHLRRVFYARDHYSEGKQPWDRRGEVYIRFGHPEHRSWSDHLVFETDQAVLRVKNRLNDAIQGMGIDHNAQSAWGFDVINTSDVGAHDGTEREVRGLPAFPVNFGKWESWIYPYVGNGIEIAFTDEVGTYDFDFAPAPNSRWRNFSPRRTIERVQSKTPSVYRHDYGGDPLDMHMVTADFRSLDRRMDDLTAYTGISMDDLTWSIVDADRRCANLEMEVAAFDSGMTRVYFDLYDTDVCVEDTVDHGRQAGHSLGGRADRCARSGGFHDRCSGQGSEDGPDTGDSAGGGCGGLQRAGVDVERPGHSHRCS
jgi:GWxTD domain-containing protein